MIRAVLLDMDGTITEPYIDWKGLRDEIGVPEGVPIMEYINGLPEGRREEALRALEAWEEEAARNAPLAEGAGELLKELRTMGVRTALVTNSSRICVEIVLERLRFRPDAVLSREDGRIKPAPDLVKKAVAALGARPEETLMVGDGIYDLEAARAAGVRFLLLRRLGYRLEHELSVGSLSEVLRLIIISEK
ncbi:MAG TPA: HAD family hydrolase [Candidatus Latescibacteria bacterium]|nr:HAD family hydrolase [Candidatus Latescibacterota bacterium]